VSYLLWGFGAFALCLLILIFGLGYLIGDVRGYDAEDP